MQIWVFFKPGVGGDGFANLLEQSPDISPLDGEYGYWRIHRIVDGKIKFYAVSPDYGECFRSNLRPFDSRTNQLYQNYKELVDKKKHCVIVSHDVTLHNLEASDQKEIFVQDQIKVLLTGDATQARLNAVTKNLRRNLPQTILHRTLDLKQFDIAIDIRDMQRDWQHVEKFCDMIGIRLDQKKYDEYRSLLLGEKNYMSNNYNVEIYQSIWHDDYIDYRLIDIWQPTLDHL